MNLYDNGGISQSMTVLMNANVNQFDFYSKITTSIEEA